MKPIVFIGMPGAGKTTVSRQLAALLGRPWFDSDLELEKAERMSVTELFERKGETYFRERETACLRRLLAEPDTVLAVGGGAVLLNPDLIARNACVVYLRRELDAIRAALPEGSRPLLKDPARLDEIYQERHTIYEALCDLAVDNAGSVNETAQRILEASGFMRPYGLVGRR
jgi:shikimate kinase